MKSNSRLLLVLTLGLVLGNAARADTPMPLPPTQSAVEAELRKTVADLERRVKELENTVAYYRTEAETKNRSLREGVQQALNMVGEEIGSLRGEIEKLKQKPNATAPSGH